MNNQLATEVIKKQRGRKAADNSPIHYFREPQEQAVREYLLDTTPKYRKSQLFETVIDKALKKLVEGILSMPKFQKLVGVNIEYLLEDAYYHVVEQMHKFDPTRESKNGGTVKAYSYYGTVIKNYILQIKKSADKRINEHGGMLDVDDLVDHIQATEDKTPRFEDLREQLILNIEYMLVNDVKLNQNDLVVGNAIKYMLINWHKIDFQKKNEFMRILGHYTHLKQTAIARSLKKFKLEAYAKNLSLNKRKSKLPKKKIIKDSGEF